MTLTAAEADWYDATDDMYDADDLVDPGALDGFTAADYDNMDEFDVPWAPSGAGRRPRTLSKEEYQDLAQMDRLASACDDDDDDMEDAHDEQDSAAFQPEDLDNMDLWDVPWASDAARRRPRSISAEEDRDLKRMSRFDRAASHADAEDALDAVDERRRFTSEDYDNMDEFDVPWHDPDRRPRSISEEDASDLARMALFRAGDEASASDEDDGDAHLDADDGDALARLDREDRALAAAKAQLRVGTDVWGDYEDAADARACFDARDMAQMQEWDVPWAPAPSARPRSLSKEDEADLTRMQRLERSLGVDVDDAEDARDACEGPASPAFTARDLSRMDEFDAPWADPARRPRSLSAEDEADLRRMEMLGEMGGAEYDDIEDARDARAGGVTAQDLARMQQWDAPWAPPPGARPRSVSAEEEEDLRRMGALDVPRALIASPEITRGKFFSRELGGASEFRAFLLR
jgi:hypothetical protein